MGEFNAPLVLRFGSIPEHLRNTSRAAVEARADGFLLAAAVTGLAVLARAGRLKTLGFDEEALLERLEKRFAAFP